MVKVNKYSTSCQYIKYFLSHYNLFVIIHEVEFMSDQIDYFEILECHKCTTFGVQSLSGETHH